MNFTLAIDLSSSFSTSLKNNGVQIQQIDKGSCPNFDNIRFWTDVAANTVYAYGGTFSDLNPWVGSTTIPLESLWSFTPNAGGGTWQSSDQSSPVFDSITRPCQGSVASGAIGGFNLGGYADLHTSQKTSTESYIPIPGLQFYNFTSKEWFNNSATAYTPYGIAAWSGTVYVPTWGPAGLLVAFGGQRSFDLSTFVDGAAYLPMSNISLFDPSTQSWYHQKATGEFPTQRDRFCVVGINGDNKSTYGMWLSLQKKPSQMLIIGFLYIEIFLYGGQMGNSFMDASSAALKDIAALDEVYILSLPSFVWFKVNYTSSDPRIEHSCVIAGNRHMLSIGGANPSAPSWDAAVNDTDPFWEGIKVFDLTALEWTNYYNASAAPYTAPAAVAAHYAAGSRYPSAWGSDDLQNLFVKPKTEAATPVNASVPDSPQPQAPSTTNRKAGVIGAAVGGTAGLIIVGLVLYFLARKRADRKNRKREGSKPPPEYTDSKPDSMEAVREAGQPLAYEADSRQALPHEVDSGQNLPHEADSRNLYELSSRMMVGSEAVHEM